jgi:hypothetical protein
MAYMSVIGACYACKRPFSFNADRVPSIPIDGVREPICEDCMAMINAKRKEKGLEPFAILPGAYEPEEVA